MTPHLQFQKSGLVEPVQPEIGERTLEYQNPFYRVRRATMTFETHTKQMYVNEFGSRSGVLFLRDEKVLLVSQGRYLIRDLSWEIPGGKISDDEEPAAGAIREAQEETGLRCLSLTPLVHYCPGLDCLENPTHVFLCTDFELRGPKGDPNDPYEITSGTWMPFDECLRMVFERQILDGMTVTALLALQAARTTGAQGLK